MRRTIIIAMSVCVLGTAGAASAMELQGSIYTEQCYALYVGSADGSVLRLSAPLRLVHSVFAGMLPGLVL